MTYKQDDYFCWIESTIGPMRLQHHKGIVEAVDDGRVAWAKGKHISVVLEWVTATEKPVKPFTKAQKQLMYFEEERKREAIWNREHWVCMEGGEGYFR